MGTPNKIDLSLCSSATSSRVSTHTLYVSRISNCRCALVDRLERGAGVSCSSASSSFASCLLPWVDPPGSEAVGSLMLFHFHFACTSSLSVGQSNQTRWALTGPLHWMRYLPRCFGSVATLVPLAGFSFAQAEGLPPLSSPKLNGSQPEAWLWYTHFCF